MIRVEASGMGSKVLDDYEKIRMLLANLPYAPRVRFLSEQHDNRPLFRIFGEEANRDRIEQIIGIIHEFGHDIEWVKTEKSIKGWK